MPIYEPEEIKIENEEQETTPKKKVVFPVYGTQSYVAPETINMSGTTVDPITVFSKDATGKYTGTVEKFTGNPDDPRPFNEQYQDFKNKQQTFVEQSKQISNYFNPEALTITDFTNNPEVQVRANEMASYLDNKTFEDGQNAADFFVDYTRGRDFNLTKAMAEVVLNTRRQKRKDPETKKFLENYSYLMNEFHAVNPNGKSKYENVGIRENTTLALDIFKGLFTDPANLPILFTGGTSLPVNIATQQAASLTLRQGIKNMAAKSYNVSLGKVAPIYNKIPKIPLDPRSYKSSIGVIGTEGAIYGGLDSHLFQRRYNLLGVQGYEEYDPTVTLMGTVFGFGIGTTIGGGTTYYLRNLSKSAKEEKAIQQTESEQFKRTILDEPDPEAEGPKILSVEEAAELNRKEREINPELSNPTHVEDVADFERRAADEEQLLPENFVNRVIDDDGIIITDKTVSQVLKEESKKVKPKIGGFQKYREEGGTIILGKSMRMFNKPTTYSKQVGEVSKFLAESGVDNGGTAYNFLRLIRNDSLEKFSDRVEDVAFDYNYLNRQYSEQIAFKQGEYLSRINALKIEAERIARNEARYTRGPGLYLRKKNYKLREGTTLNDDLYMFLNQGRFQRDVPESIIKIGGKFRKLYNDIEKDAIMAGFEFHKVPNFFPRYLKSYKVSRLGSRGRTRYAQQLVDDGYFDNLTDAKDAVKRQTDKLEGDFDPSEGSLGQRTYKNLDTYNIRDLFEQDVYATTMMYANSTARKIVTKKTLGFGEFEQDQKWFIPMFGGKDLVKTTPEDAFELVTKNLMARGFDESFVNDPMLKKYIDANFLARQNITDTIKSPVKDEQGNIILDRNGNQVLEDIPLPLTDLIKANNKLRSNASALSNNFKFNNLTVSERNQLYAPSFQESIDNIILNNFKSGTFTRQSGTVIGELDPANVNYLGMRSPSDEKARLKTLVENVTGQYGRGTPEAERFTGTLLALQAANKLSMATFSSLPESFIPMFKATPKLAVQAFLKTVFEEGGKAASNLLGGTKGLPSLTRAEMHQHNKMMSSAMNEALNARYGDNLTGISQKLTYAFYRSIFLDQYTKFVQIYSYNAGKLLIRENLSKLDKMGKEAFNKNNKKAMRLRSTINQLGVNVDEGIQWHRSGGAIDDPFYQNLQRSANRFVDEVVMIPSRENAQKFIASSHWAARVAFQLYSYPIAFTNTVLRNALRDMSVNRDFGTAAKHAAGLSLMYYATGFTQRLKGVGELDAEPIDQAFDTLHTMGISGPFMIVDDVMNNISYGSNTPRSFFRLLGPTVGGMLLDALQGDTPFSSAVFKNTLPYRNLIRKLSPELVFEIEEGLKDLERRRYLTRFIGLTPQGELTRDRKYFEAQKRFEFQKELKDKRDRQRDLKEERLKLFTGGKASNLTFNQQYHRDTIAQNQAMLNSDKSVTTAKVKGVEYKGKIYNLPSYDRNGGFFTDEELRKKYEVEMETGVIKGYDKNFDGPIENHPANVAARKEHELMMAEAELARGAINPKYTNTPSKEIVSGLKAGMRALGFADGGRVSLATGGKLSEDYPVPFTKSNPSERKISGTNESYAVIAGLFEEEDRVPVRVGGLLGKQAAKNKTIKTNLFKKKAGWKWTKVPEGFDPNPDGQFPLVSVETGGKHFYSLQADFPEGVLLERYAKQKSEPRLRPTTKGVIRTGNKIGEIRTSSGKLHPVYDNIVAVDEKTKAVKGLKDMPTNVMPAPQRFFDPEDKGYKPFLSNFDYIKGGRYVEINKEGNKDITGATPKQARISISPEGKASFTISKEFYDSIFPQQTIRQFHGTKNELPEVLQDFDMGYQGSESNIYGAGFYTTSESGIAKGYAKKTDRRTGETAKGFVYEITEKKGNKLYNLDSKVPDQIKKDILEPELDISTELEDELAGFLEENPNASFLELYDEAREISRGYQIPTYEVQELFNGWAMYLIDQGYNGLRHKGGVLSGGKEHDVKIYWNPSQSLNVKLLK
tara:strand:+ start:5943 stop:11885 length:5943 start_codon:yes stop_codon:yes gene_type:complete